MQTYYHEELRRRLTACRRAVLHAHSDDLKRLFRQRERELRDIAALHGALQPAPTVRRMRGPRGG